MPREQREVNSQAPGSRPVADDLPLKVEPLLAITPPRIQAVLKFALLVQIVERPVPEPDEDDDGDQGEEIAAPAGARLLSARWGLAHAMRPGTALTSISPRAASALATIPFAS